jgi:eukaryotic-like serine/threonine-protein kinase
MGEVYLARDQHLDRDVAVKVLLRGSLEDEQARERFRREAHVLSRLSHPGVATIFDFDRQDGIDFLVMEYVPGGTLEAKLRGGPLPVDEVIRIGAEIGDALEVAHARGFLHRDLKPGNVVLTSAGVPKLLDFGLAGLLHSTHTATKSTMHGSVFGSLPYMAPEQIKGEEGSAATDVYGLGAVLYEMATGRRAFDRSRPEAVLFEILHGSAAPLRSLRPDAPPAFERLVESCLSKDPAHRPPSARALSAALRAMHEDGGGGDALAAAVPSAFRSLAVLPLENVTRDPAQEYFVDGLTEALISELARIGALRVISRTSAMKYKGVAKSLPEIGRELRVDAILEGSALLVGQRVRVTVRLVSARDDETLWTERYEDSLEDVLDLQNRVAEKVAKEIAVKVTPREATRLARRQSVNPEAHLEYLRGQHAARDASPQAVILAMKHFQRALEVDADYAPAWAGIADCHAIRAQRGMAPAAEAVREGEEAARRSLELDESLAIGHAVLGAIRLQQLDIPASLRSLERAIELNPGLADTHQILGRVLYSLERHAEGQKAMLRALELDPMSMIIHTSVGDAYYYARQYERSLVYYRKAIELDPRFDGAHTDLARSLEALGRFDESEREYQEGRRLSGGVAGPTFGLGHLEASRGNIDAARAILNELVEARSQRVVSPWGIAALHASLGDVDEAFRWLDVAVDERSTGLAFLRVHPRIDSIRKDPRYRVLLERVRLANV